MSFSVVNELAATTNQGPYVLNLYTDNPTISLKATQSGSAGEAAYSYNWLAACNGGGGTRVGAGSSIESVLELRLKGNPIQNGQVSVEVRGAAEQPLSLHLVDTQGHVIDRHQVEQAGLVERHTFGISSQATGVLFLRATTPTQSKTVKLIKAD